MTEPAALAYAEWPAARALRTWVAAYWTFTVRADQAPFDHRVPPTGGAVLAMNLRGGPAVLVGPRTSPLVIPVQGGDRYVGIHLWPGVHRAWLGRAGQPLRERQLPLANLLDGAWVAGLERALRDGAVEGRWSELDQALAGRGLGAPLDPSVLAAVARVIADAGQSPVGSLAASVGLSPTQFRRRFLAAVELTPKELARLRRVRASAGDAVQGGRWAAIAAERGYADQAHLVREFQELLGLPPEAFRRQGSRMAHRLLGG